MSVVSMSPLTLRQARAFLADRGIKAAFGSRLAIGAVDDSGWLLGVVVAGGPVPDWTGPGPTLAVTQLYAESESPQAAVLLSLAIRRASASLGYRNLVIDLPADRPPITNVLHATGWTYTDHTPFRLPGEVYGWGERWTTSARYFDHTPTTVCLGKRRFWQRCNPQ